MRFNVTHEQLMNSLKCADESRFTDSGVSKAWLVMEKRRNVPRM